MTECKFYRFLNFCGIRKKIPKNFPLTKLQPAGYAGIGLDKYEVESDLSFIFPH